LVVLFVVVLFVVVLMCCWLRGPDDDGAMSSAALVVLSREVTQWITIALKRTVVVVNSGNSLEVRRDGERKGYELSLLQHIKHTQPGSPFRPTRTERLLWGVSVMCEEG
jgi:hypothetical protein